MERVSTASPVSLQTSSRLRKSFERVKAQVDVDLLHFRRELFTQLGSPSDAEGLFVLQRCQPASCTDFDSRLGSQAMLATSLHGQHVCLGRGAWRNKSA